MLKLKAMRPKSRSFYHHVRYYDQSKSAFPIFRIVFYVSISSWSTAGKFSQFVSSLTRAQSTNSIEVQQVETGRGDITVSESSKTKPIESNRDTLARNACLTQFEKSTDKASEQYSKQRKTELLQDPEKVVQRIKEASEASRSGLSMFSNMEALQFAYDNLLPSYKKALQNYNDNASATGLRYLVTMEKKDLVLVQVLRGLLELGIQIRHCPNVPPINFTIVDSTSLYFTLARTEESHTPSQLVVCWEQGFVKRYETLFENLWINSVDVERRIKDIEEGRSEDEGQIEVIHNPKEIRRKLVELVETTSREILLMLPTQRAFHSCEKIDVVDAILQASMRKCISAKILAPFDQQIRNTVKLIEETTWLNRDEESQDSSVLLFREIDRSSTETQLIILVVDGGASLVIELKNGSSEEFEDAVGSAIYSRSRPTVSSYVTFFEKLWHESELRCAEQSAKSDLQLSLEKEEKMRRRAELLQDIMTHDIRNYNQIGLLSAEMLREELKDREDLRLMVDSLLASMRYSIDLLERARRLGLVLSEHEVELEPVPILDRLDKAMSVIRSASPDKRIHESRAVSPSLQLDRVEVLADDFLTEVFVNLYSNFVKFTSGSEVYLETCVEQVVSDGLAYLKITISDHGRGVPDELKKKIFTRYLGGEKGIGLGMSIIYALVVERYHGRLLLRDRVEGDHTQGATVEVLLREKIRSLGASE